MTIQDNPVQPVSGKELPKHTAWQQETQGSRIRPGSRLPVFLQELLYSCNFVTCLSFLFWLSFWFLVVHKSQQGILKCVWTLKYTPWLGKSVGYRCSEAAGIEQGRVAVGFFSILIGSYWRWAGCLHFSLHFSLLSNFSTCKRQLRILILSHPLSAPFILEALQISHPRPSLRPLMMQEWG